VKNTNKGSPRGSVTTPTAAKVLAPVTDYQFDLELLTSINHLSSYFKIKCDNSLYNFDSNHITVLACGRSEVLEFSAYFTNLKSTRFAKWNYLFQRYLFSNQSEKPMIRWHKKVVPNNSQFELPLILGKNEIDK